MIPRSSGVTRSTSAVLNPWVSLLSLWSICGMVKTARSLPFVKRRQLFISATPSSATCSAMGVRGSNPSLAVSLMLLRSRMIRPNRSDPSSPPTAMRRMTLSLRSLPRPLSRLLNCLHLPDFLRYLSFLGLPSSPSPASLPGFLCPTVPAVKAYRCWTISAGSFPMPTVSLQAG